MTDHPDNSSPQKPTMMASPAPNGDAENPTPAISGGGGGGGGGVSNILSRWKREDLMKKGSLGSRGLGFVFSLLAFIIMASNQHGDWQNFDKYEEYRYLLGIAILSTLYTGLQAGRQIHELSTGREMFSPPNIAMFDFIGDQVIAYLLMSSASSAVPLTNRMRVNNDNIFTDSSTSAISMEFLAFVCVSVSALISGYKLCKQTYI